MFFFGYKYIGGSMRKKKVGQPVIDLLLSKQTHYTGRFYTDVEVAERCNASLDYVRKIRGDLGIPGYAQRLSEFQLLVLRQHTNAEAARILGTSVNSITRKRKLMNLPKVKRLGLSSIIDLPSDSNWVVQGEPIKDNGYWKVLAKCKTCGVDYLVTINAMNTGKSKGCMPCSRIRLKKKSPLKF